MAVTITSTADKEVTVILADAQKKSEIMKVKETVKEIKFLQMLSVQIEFLLLQSYASEKALIGGETSLILSPDSEFFKFFGNIKPKKENYE